MANGILGAIAQGPQRSPIQSYLAGKQMKGQREQRELQSETQRLQQQKLSQVLRQNASAQDLQEFFYTSLAAASLNDPAKQRAMVENMSKKFDPNSMVGQMTGGLLGEKDLDKALFQTIPMGQAIGVLEKPTGGAAATPAEQRTFEFLIADLPPEEQEKAKRIKLGLDPRATEDATEKAEKAAAVEVAKLAARFGWEPKVAGAVQAAKNEANVTAKEAGKKRDATTAWNVYNGAMSNLAKAMSATATGPFVGYLPAVSSNQQIAEGAVAVMAPVLKQMFRSAGEGTFTDQDQKLLMDMIPKRTDTPEARVQKIENIDRIVRAKLNIAPPEQQTGPPTVQDRAPVTPGQIKFMGFE